jgi:hypothetical protein
MKSVTGYVNQRRLHELLRELRNAGVREIDVIEYFSQPAGISHLRLVCQDETVEKACSLMAGIGSTGTACDHCLRVVDVETNAYDGNPLQTSYGSRQTGGSYA